MAVKIFREFSIPDRVEMTQGERWHGPDEGLITCWEVGRKMRWADPALAKKVEAGELPPMGWKGGCEKRLKIPIKYGTFRYLAQWQGAAGMDLDVDASVDREMICSKTGQKVVFTEDSSKYANQV